MSYDPLRKYRCTIIRGKAQKEVEDLIPLYCQIIHSLCPCPKNEFKDSFDNELSYHMYGKPFDVESKAHKKVIRNHRTEIAGKLYSLYCFEDDKVLESPLCKFFLETRNLPALFKCLCLNFQFPNGSQKLQQTVKDNIVQGLHLKPYHFILQLLKLAYDKGVSLTCKEVGIYVLNSLDVLQGKVKPLEVLTRIIQDRGNGIPYKLNASSKDYQHIREQINFLTLANLVTVVEDGKDKFIKLNTNEPILKTFLKESYTNIWNVVYEFYDASTDYVNRSLESEWMKYASTIRHSKKVLTQISFEYVGGEKLKTYSTKEIGDEGELLVLDFEKNRLLELGVDNPDVKWVAKQKGIGYDVQSIGRKVSGNTIPNRYIEVKSTTRITTPDEKSMKWMFKFCLTRNEWYAAEKYKEHFYIYIVSLSALNKSLFVIENPFEKYQNGQLFLSAPTYDAKISAEYVDNKIQL